MPVTAAQQNAARRGVAPREGAFIPLGAHTQNATIGAATVIAPAALADDLESRVNCILLQSTGTNVRYTLDGSTPTATNGFVLTAGYDPILLYWGTGVILTVIQESATATLIYQWGCV